MSDIPWDCPAHFSDVTKDGSLNGSLRECVHAYLALPADDRRDAMIVTDELVPLEGKSAVKMLTPHDLETVAKQL